MLPGSEVPRRLVIALAAQEAHAVHHQTGIAGHLANYRLVQAFSVGSVALHCDARGEGGAALRAGHRIEAGRIVGLLGEQQ